MQKFTKTEIMKYLNKFIIQETNIPKEAIEEYKSKVSDIILEIQDEVLNTYNKGDAITQEKVIQFLEKSKVNSDNPNKIMNSSAYLTFEIPIILPIEVAAMCMLLHKTIILYCFTRLSEILTNDMVNYVVSVSINNLQEEFMLMDLMKKQDPNKLN